MLIRKGDSFHVEYKPGPWLYSARSAWIKSSHHDECNPKQPFIYGDRDLHDDHWLRTFSSRPIK